ncbi:MAG: response regulator [Gemmatimonadaceae bacterium]
MKSVLIVEDEPSIRDTLVELFEHTETSVVAADSLESAMHELARSVFDFIVSDIRLGGRRDGGLQVLGAAGLLSPKATIIMLTAFPDDDTRLAAQRLSAAYFLEKPVELMTIASIAARHGVPTAMLPAAAIES